MYWVSFIQKDSKDSEPRLCAAYNSCSYLEEAKQNILKQRRLYDVLSAWIDDDLANETVFHECYIDSCGYISKPNGNEPCTVKYANRDYSDEYTYDSEEEANEAIRSEIEVVKENLGLEDFEKQYRITDYGDIVEITRIIDGYLVCRWTRMWR